MNKETLIEILNLVQSGLTETEATIKVVGKEIKLYYYKKKFGLLKYKRGTNPNSCLNHRRYKVNDNFFSIPTILSSYYAGFIAADGNIKKDSNLLTIGLSSKDKPWLKEFIKYLDSDYEIHEYVQNGHNISYINITSSKICEDLNNIYNITPCKSLTLQAPNIIDTDLIDAFIVGLIDGDGCIGTTGNRFYITITGTYNILNFVKVRIEEILEKPVGKIISTTDSNFVFRISDKNARIVYNTLNRLNLPKLKRKWCYDKLNIDKPRKRNIDKYKLIYSLKNQGKTQSEIAKELGVTQSAISWYMKQSVFKSLNYNEIQT